MRSLAKRPDFKKMRENKSNQSTSNTTQGRTSAKENTQPSLADTCCEKGIKTQGVSMEHAGHCVDDTEARQDRKEAELDDGKTPKGGSHDDANDGIPGGTGGFADDASYHMYSGTDDGVCGGSSGCNGTVPIDFSGGITCNIDGAVSGSIMEANDGSEICSISGGVSDSIYEDCIHGCGINEAVSGGMGNSRYGNHTDGISSGVNDGIYGDAIDGIAGRISENAFGTCNSYCNSSHISNMKDSAGFRKLSIGRKLKQRSHSLTANAEKNSRSLSCGNAVDLQIGSIAVEPKMDFSVTTLGSDEKKKESTADGTYRKVSRIQKVISKKERNLNKTVALTCVIIVFVYLICTTPYAIQIILGGDPLSGYTGFMLFSNSLFNPLVYFFKGYLESKIRKKDRRTKAAHQKLLTRTVRCTTL